MNKRKELYKHYTFKIGGALIRCLLSFCTTKDKNEERKGIKTNQFFFCLRYRGFYLSELPVKAQASLD